MKDINAEKLNALLAKWKKRAEVLRSEGKDEYANRIDRCRHDLHFFLFGAGGLK